MKTNFFLQFFQRIFIDSPKFFKYIRWAAGVLALLAATATWLINKSIWTPAAANAINAIVAQAWPVLTGIWAMTHLPVKDQTPTINIK